jgi:hypothetical protein
MTSHEADRVAIRGEMPGDARRRFYAMKEKEEAT